MTKLELLMKMNGVTSVKTETPKAEPEIIYIDREDFDLLDVTYSNVTYYINEMNGTVKVQKGEF